MKGSKMHVLEKLFSLQDEKYGDFSAKLTPNISRDSFIGVRSPDIRAFAKEVHKNKEVEAEYLQTLPHKYVEEYLLHIHLINKEKDLDKCISRINEILPYIDNWMTCDAIRPAIFKKHLHEVEGYIKACVESRETYVSRFGIEMLMCCYLDEAFDQKYLEWVSLSRIDDYYHKMMIAWYFATALAKQYDSSFPYIRDRKLEKWTHNKVIQKARESYRVSNERKEQLKALKICKINKKHSL